MAYDTYWMEHAACIGLDGSIFFPVTTMPGKPVDYSKAKAVCWGCPCKRTCGAYAIAHNIPDGVWGGFTKYERRKIPLVIRKKIRKLWFERHPSSAPTWSMPGDPERRATIHSSQRHT